MTGAVIAIAAMLTNAAAERQELQADQKTRCCWRRQAFYSVHEATSGDLCRECRSVRCSAIEKRQNRHQAQRRLGKICLAPGFGLKTLLCRHMKAAIAETPHAHEKILRQRHRPLRRRKKAANAGGYLTGPAAGPLSAGVNP